MDRSVELTHAGRREKLPIVEGTEGQQGVAISELRENTGLVTFDPGYKNTAACRSAITFINGERGILRHRGYPIEALAERVSFIELAYLLIYGELPREPQEWEQRLQQENRPPEDMKRFFEGFPTTADSMAALGSAVLSLSAFSPQDEPLDATIVRLLAQSKSLAAMIYRRLQKLPFVDSRCDLGWPADFLHMIESDPSAPRELPRVAAETLDLLLLLHADHGQNCSTSTMRMIGSSDADIFASTAGAIGALSGPRHGRANQRVIEMLQRIKDQGSDVGSFVASVKDKKERLMGFGHRVYKNYDPRARILKTRAPALLEQLGKQDPLLELAQQLEEVALSDDYFRERRLYPNVDFYSGILLRGLGLPSSLFTVVFALGRLPGWIAHFREMKTDEGSPIHRPRQIYVGQAERALE